LLVGYVKGQAIFLECVVPEIYPYPFHRGNWKILRGWGVGVTNPGNSGGGWG